MPPPSLVPSAPSAQVIGTLLLVGDAGVPALDDPVLAAVAAAVAEAPTRVTVVFLGDNIYPTGLPAEDAPRRDTAEARLRAQLEAARGAASIVFVPGNHDWTRGADDGWDAIRRQATFVAGLGVPNARVLPEQGCPGPTEVAPSPLRVTVLDTQWWLHDGPKPRDPSSACDADSPGEVTAQLRRWLRADSTTPAVVLGHHPILTGGVHGGYFTWKDHLFPLTALKSWLWIPLPIIGSGYPLARSLGISKQDMSSGRYQEMRDSLAAAFRARPPLVYAAGHEHNLQILDGDSLGVHTLVVSGSGAFQHTSPIARLRETRYASAASGFVRLDALRDGRVRLAVIEVGDDRRAREAHSEWLVSGSAAAP
jgi:hypothetical protein